MGAARAPVRRDFQINPGSAGARDTLRAGRLGYDRMTTASGPLVGLRVLDLGTRIGAPFAATLLADLGADVIKVELPSQGDFMRTIGPFDHGYSLFWAVEGRGKR